MPDLFTHKRLGLQQIDQAFPIVQSVMTGLSVDDWRDFARRFAAYPDGDAGIMTVQYQGYIHGLFSYTIEPHLIHDRVLMVDNFIVLDLFNPRAVAIALLEAMDGLCRTLCCGAAHTMLPSGPQMTAEYRRWLLAQFRRHGHEVESLALCKRVAEATVERPLAGAPVGRAANLVS